jgi:CRISPR-associated protein Csb1
MGEDALENLSLEELKQAVTGTAAAFRCVTEYPPVGGSGDKVFPPTYQGGRYAVEKRRLPGESEPVVCVLLDSVQSQANRMEMALLEMWERKQIPLPVVAVDFADCGLPKVLRITSLEAPHRIADALLRDSFLDASRSVNLR